jgi:hypothetical protein
MRSIIFVLIFCAGANAADTAQTGLCHAPNDEAQLNADNHAFAKALRSCVKIRLFSLSARLNINCLAKAYPDMSGECLGCFEKLTSCAADRCKKACAPWPFGHGEKSKDCSDCSLLPQAQGGSGCSEEWEQCSGQPASRLPQRAT